MKDKRLLLPILSLIIVFSLVSTAAAALELDAKAALLMDAKSGRILYADNIDAPLPVASLTKMMTLTVVLEAIIVRPQRTIREKESTHSSPLSTYSAPGGLPQDPGRAA